MDEILTAEGIALLRAARRSANAWQNCECGHIRGNHTVVLLECHFCDCQRFKRHWTEKDE